MAITTEIRVVKRVNGSEVSERFDIEPYLGDAPQGYLHEILTQELNGKPGFAAFAIALVSDNTKVQRIFEFVDAAVELDVDLGGVDVEIIDTEAFEQFIEEERPDVLELL